MVNVFSTVALFMDIADAVKFSSVLPANDEISKEACRKFVAVYKDLREVRDIVNVLYHRETYKDLYDALDYLDEIYNNKNGKFE